MLSEQTFLNAGILLTNATATAAVAGYVFNILMIARAPLQLFQAVQTSLLPHLTTLGSRGDEQDFRASIRVTIIAIAGFAALVALAMLVAGPHLMQIAFGKKHDYNRADLVAVAIGMGLYLSAATLNQAALARGQVRRASYCWIGCAIAFIIWIAGPGRSTAKSRAWWSATSGPRPCSARCSTGSPGSRSRPKEQPFKPGSTEEMELQLASGDEAGLAQVAEYARVSPPGHEQRLELLQRIDGAHRDQDVAGAQHRVRGAAGSARVPSSMRSAAIVVVPPHLPIVFPSACAALADVDLLHPVLRGHVHGAGDLRLSARRAISAPLDL